MERGLLWLPLLILFIGLAWAGWNEYQKLSAYQAWASGFERAKYDIYAVIGQGGDRLTWGIPTRKGPINLQTLILTDIQSVALTNGATTLPASELPALDQGDRLPKQARNQVALVLSLATAAPVTIPFSDLSLAIKWGIYLEQARTAPPRAASADTQE